MKRIAFLFAITLAVSFSSTAQQSSTEQEAAYTRIIHQRADKIVATLNLKDSSKANDVRIIIATQYRNLNEIYTNRDNKIKTAKQALAGNKDSLSVAVNKIEGETTPNIATLHASYIKKLSSKLTNEQVVKVKDGMTYGVLPITYNGYQQMILSLTDEQKSKIMEWLVEAREHAMDAESSDKKHAWFGKYKGRINNYLSAQGYDLRKEGVEWEKRRKAAKSATANTAQ